MRNHGRIIRKIVIGVITQKREALIVSPVTVMEYVITATETDFAMDAGAVSVMELVSAASVAEQGY